MKDTIDAANYVLGGADFAGTFRRRCRSCRHDNDNLSLPIPSAWSLGVSGSRRGRGRG